jgi:hypothetical protein
MGKTKKEEKFSDPSWIKPPDAMPTMGGSFLGFLPEYLEFKSNKWLPIPIETVNHPMGIPFPKFGGGILSTIYLYGYEQAHALAWSFAAYLKSLGKNAKVRLVTYDIEFDIKARKDDSVINLLDIDSAEDENIWTQSR